MGRRPLVPLIALALAAAPAVASAQTESGPLSPESYATLSADADAQASLGGFRLYLERVREGDAELYAALDPRLRSLEERETISDVVFWSGFIVGLGLLGAAIPVALEDVGLEPTIGLLVAGGSTLALAVLIAAIVRPGHADLVRLFEVHDRQIGRSAGAPLPL